VDRGLPKTNKRQRELLGTAVVGWLFLNYSDGNRFTQTVLNYSDGNRFTQTVFGTGCGRRWS
jgi:hypothetical protein